MNALDMPKLIPVEYNGIKYPNCIEPTIQEIPAHFDKKKIFPEIDYSLHTEYSYGRRKFESDLVKELDTITSSHKRSVPKLWFNKDWVEEFIDFIKKLVGKNKPPRIIEIHPPFDDYCESIGDFINIYEIFENKILDIYPKVDIVIENRYGTRYSGGKFLISDSEDLLELHKVITSRELNLDIVLDFPQLFTSNNITTGRFTEDNIKSVIKSTNDFKKSITGIHIWGKKDYGDGVARAHLGDLKSYFEDESLKKLFLDELNNLLDDNNPRYFVPEINSGFEDLKSIVNDFLKFGFKFV